MKLEVTNANYLATIVKVKNLVDVGLNTLMALPIFGIQALVPKTTKEGDLLVLFPAEVQLSEDYCRMNNLYRKSELNFDQTKTGYIEENRRVRAIKLGGQFSTALAMPLDSLSNLGFKDISSLKEGDTFNNIDGKEICKKYQIKENTTGERGNNIRGLNKKFKRVETKLFPEHLDSEQYLRNSDKIQDNEIVIISQKLHGSSGRFANILVNRELKWFEKILKKLGLPVIEQEYGYVAGSRRTVKDSTNNNSNHYYSTDIWNNILEKYKLQIPKGYIIYGEIVGYTQDGGMIQKGYHYGQKEKESELYVYRVVHMNPDGIGIDLTFHQMKTWCKQNGFKTVPELATMLHSEFKLIRENYQEVNYAKLQRKYMTHAGNSLYIDQPLDNGDEVPEEGVCIRVDGLTPYILKMKNQSFLIGESKQLDSGEIDIESAN